jgi:AraC-like DNA-binding protein
MIFSVLNIKPNGYIRSININMFSVIEVIGLLALFLAVLLAIFFLKQTRGSILANRILSLVLFIFALLIIHSVIIGRGASQAIGKLSLLVSQTSFLLGPLIYFYFCLQLGKRKKLKPIDLLHLLPFIFSVSFLLHLFYIKNEFILWESMPRISGSVFFLIQNMVYLTAVLLNIKLSNHSIRTLLLKSKQNPHPGLRFLLMAYIILWTVQIQTFLILDLWNKYRLCPYLTSIYFLVVFILMTIFIYRILTKPRWFLLEKKYRNSPLNEKEKQMIYDRLIDYFEKQQVYQDSSLTLPKLAKSLGVASWYLSQVINEKFGRNFYEFVNSYRIKDSMHRLQQANKSQNILQIAYEVGFNSKSAFNLAFKKYTGKTPACYKQQTLQD